MRQLISDQLKRSHINIDTERFNFTVTYIQDTNKTSCCYQFDHASLDILTTCLKILPHPYHPSFVLILRYACMHASDEFIFRYKEKMAEGVPFNNSVHSTLFYVGDNNYHIIYEVEKLFYTSDRLFNIEVCRYNNFVLEITMDEAISEPFRAAINVAKDDLEDQFKANIDNNLGRLENLFYKNFMIHGEAIQERTQKYIASLDD